MIYNWKQVTNELITNLYLYGQETTPANLVSEQWIRPVDDTATQTDNKNCQQMLAEAPCTIFLLKTNP